jgi:putative membrane protein
MLPWARETFLELSEMGYGHGWGMGDWGMGFGFIFWLVILGIIITGALWFVRSKPLAGKRSTGLELLEERYARGEIDREEYLQKKRDIVGDNAGS